MRIHDWAMPASLTVVCFVMLLLGDRKKWLLVDALSTIVTGSMFVLMPTGMMRIYVRNVLNNIFYALNIKAYSLGSHHRLMP